MILISTRVPNRIVTYVYLNEMFNLLLYLPTVFLFQFLGECQVESPKGTDVVKDAIRKRKVKVHLLTLHVR